MLLYYFQQFFHAGSSALFMYHDLRGRREFSVAVPHVIQRCRNNFGLRDVDEIRERTESFSDGLRETEADGFEILFGWVFDDRQGVSSWSLL
jgi:hypothetical protein